MFGNCVTAAPAFFFPDCSGANPAHFERVGLAASVGEGAEFADVLDAGPSGGRGMLAAWPRHGGGLQAAGYEWHAAKADADRSLDAGRFYIGLPPGGVKPPELARREAVAGYVIELADGQAWRVPSLKNLPKRLGLDDAGRVVAFADGPYSQLAARADQYAVQFFRAANELAALKAARPTIDVSQVVEFTLADGWNFACDVLAINYRLCRELVDVLGLLATQEAASNVIKCAFDLAGIVKGEAQPREMLRFTIQ